MLFHFQIKILILAPVCNKIFFFFKLRSSYSIKYQIADDNTNLVVEIKKAVQTIDIHRSLNIHRYGTPKNRTYLPTLIFKRFTLSAIRPIRYHQGWTVF